MRNVKLCRIPWANPAKCDLGHFLELCHHRHPAQVIITATIKNKMRRSAQWTQQGRPPVFAAIFKSITCACVSFPRLCDPHQTITAQYWPGPNWIPSNPSGDDFNRSENSDDALDRPKNRLICYWVWPKKLTADRVSPPSTKSGLIMTVTADLIVKKRRTVFLEDKSSKGSGMEPRSGNIRSSAMGSANHYSSPLSSAFSGCRKQTR